MPNESLFIAAKCCLDAQTVAEKIRLTNQADLAWRSGDLNTTPCEIVCDLSPGRPDRPEMVEIKDLPRRNLRTPEGLAALIHAIAHIEYNAIDLAWDAVYRFQDMPEQFYTDWSNIAREEASHFLLIQNFLNSIGYQYGDFAAHRGLWDMAVATEYDVLVRMALVPRVMEARGLDVTPGIMQKLQQAGYPEAAAILQVIYDEEHGHVAVGNHWFHYLCEKRGVKPLSTFKDLIKLHAGGKIRKPINRQARLDSGFTEEELLYLDSVI